MKDGKIKSPANPPDIHRGEGEILPVVRMDIRFWLNYLFMGAKCRIDSPPTARMYAFSNDPEDPVREVVFVRDGTTITGGLSL
jgi:hypothetical protein